MNQESIISMSARDMAAHLQEVEECKVLINPYHSNPVGFDLYFVPDTFHVSNFSNVEMLVTWAIAHRYTVSLNYDTFKNAIVAKVNRLFPEETYAPEDILK